MLPDYYIFKVYKMDNKGNAIHYCGTAFPITKSGYFLTCHHVLNHELKDGEHLAIWQSEDDSYQKITETLFDKNFDTAAFHTSHYLKKILPFADPSTFLVGEDVYTYGHYINKYDGDRIAAGFFKGNVVNFSPNSLVSNMLACTLSFPIIEGLSGSPLLTYMNGVKVVGLNIGNNDHRIEQSVVTDYHHEKGYIRETVNRIVEFGISLHPTIIITFLNNVGITDYLITSEEFEVS
jgi:hypothetical protein